jgi:DNA-binding protein HU-beta
MNISDLAERIAAEHGLSKVAAKTMLESVLKGITDAAASGAEVSLAGFGKFKVQERPARQGRNPKTGETIQIAASKKLMFQPAKGVKDALNGG